MVLREVERGFSMGCNYPVGTYNKKNEATYRPCGSCIGCRLEYSRQWAVRMICESKMHKENSFITLTYNNDNLPQSGSVDRKELQDFMKRLRRKVEPKKIRFYGAGEYGENFGRPHYHICLFGYDFPDKILHKGAKRTYWKGGFKKGHDNSLYTSEMLGEVWKKGFHTVGQFTFETAGYTARYVTKKVTGEHQKKWYGDKEPEFALMSRNPGIGKPWLDKYMTDVYPKDFHTVNGIKQRPNRYYDYCLNKKDPECFEQIKEERIKKAKKLPYESHLRKHQKELHRKSVTKQLERKLENARN